MLLDDDPGLRIEGPQSDVLAVVYAVTSRLLVEAGYCEADADAMALRLMPRLHDRLATYGFVVRAVQADDQLEFAP